MPTWYIWVFMASPVAILIATWLAWRKHRVVAAREATLKFIAEKEIYNQKWREAQTHVYNEYDKIASSDSPPHLLSAAGTLLKHYELVAVAIKTESMDEVLYKGWNKTAFVNSWDRLHSFVYSRRTKTGQTSMYCEFEELATKWKSE